ncbi:hypothetical protein Smic_08270 [Streptomyces microflavus]|uniref:Response regulatory domain-containing protein n=1 Tax=Streptomyces microflavus TaxID=1919 RepID=A0A7J0CIE2_STRMI|nr:hypothetical protein Smic_08270 [Streptomyces microflavus]
MLQRFVRGTNPLIGGAEMQVLVVEDDARIAEALTEALQRFGHEVDWVASGAEALRAVPDAQFVLLDLGLPDLDGQEVCRRVRETSAVPIIAVTARSEELDRILVLQAGADDYMVKPYSMRELMARMEAVCRRTRSSPPRAQARRKRDACSVRSPWICALDRLLCTVSSFASHDVSSTCWQHCSPTRGPYAIEKI